MTIEQAAKEYKEINSAGIGIMEMCCFKVAIRQATEANKKRESK